MPLLVSGLGADTFFGGYPSSATLVAGLPRQCNIMPNGTAGPGVSAKTQGSRQVQFLATSSKMKYTGFPASTGHELRAATATPCQRLMGTNLTYKTQ